MSETDEPRVIEMENGPDIVAYSAGEVAYLRQAAAGTPGCWSPTPRSVCGRCWASPSRTPSRDFR